MGLCKHRDVLPFLSHALDHAENFFEKRHEALLYGLLEGKRNRCVVDVLGCESEVDELSPFHDVHFLETVLDVIFDRLDVMVGHFFDFLHFCGIFRSHGPVDVSQGLEFRLVKVGKLRQRNAAECDEIFYLDANSILYEGVLTEIFLKDFGLTGISSVYRRHRQK